MMRARRASSVLCAWRAKLSRGCRSTRGARHDEGQATLEYLLVTLGIIAIVVALGALVRFGADGRLVGLACQAASHALGSQAGNALLDALLF
ncbi:MAG: hypothetical protein KHY83_05165 [Coriobacteriia bacterium]|nr:hypothetical protein [Coriobacteriia bacterium]MBS5478036.1 hypothetical protein [Coriobacteriia bacterium]